jgi:uncharacterized membrane protein
MKLKTNRMETLTDGIFAIVMTVMLVGLSEIFTFKEGSGNADFSFLFNSLADDFMVYAVSFLILGVLWFEHHWQFHFIKHIDPVLSLINIVWFMFLCLIPFTTMLVGNYPSAFEPLFACELNILIVFFLLQMHWIYATRKLRCVDSELDKKVVMVHRNISSLIVALVICVILASYLYHILK